jgi:hypothetical protein
MTGKLVAENYSSLLLCGSSKRLQLRRQDFKSNNMQHQKMVETPRWQRCWAEKKRSRRVASEALLGGSRKQLQQGHCRSTLGGVRKRLQQGRSGS